MISPCGAKRCEIFMRLLQGQELFTGFIHIAGADGEDHIAGAGNLCKILCQLRKARTVDAAGNLIGKVF